MTTPRKSPTPLLALGATLRRIETQAERMLGRFRRDVEGFMTRSRSDFAKDLRALERRVLKAVHAATREDVARLQKRVAKLENRLPPPSETGSERAA
jgi:BMFP domain-containing protein YqiC